MNNIANPLDENYYKLIIQYTSKDGTTSQEYVVVDLYNRVCLSHFSGTKFVDLKKAHEKVKRSMQYKCLVKSCKDVEIIVVSTKTVYLSPGQEETVTHRNVE